MYANPLETLGKAVADINKLFHEHNEFARVANSNFSTHGALFNYTAWQLKAIQLLLDDALTGDKVVRTGDEGLDWKYYGEMAAAALEEERKKSVEKEPELITPEPPPTEEQAMTIVFGGAEA